MRSVAQGVEIIQNNYNSFSANTAVYRSHKFLFTNSEKLEEINPNVRLKNDIAHNEIKFSRVLPDHVLTSTEVWKSNNGTTTLTQNAASYYVGSKNYVDLLPVPYGENHAGFSSEELIDEEGIYLLEISTEFFGHQNGGYKGSMVTAYNLDRNTLSTNLCSQDCILPKVKLPMTTQVYLRRIDLDFDGLDEVYVTGYKDNGVHIFYLRDGKLRQINSKRFALKDVGGWYGRVNLLRDINEKCIYSISAISNSPKGKRTIDIRTSTCRKRRL